MVGWIYTALLVAVVAFIVARGGQEERIVVLTLMLGSFTTFLIYATQGRDFTALQLELLLNEAWILAVMLAVAYRSKRFWPLPVAACELAAFMSLMTPWLGANVVSYGLGVTQGLWAYLQLAMLVLAVVRGRARRPAVTTHSGD